MTRPLPRWRYIVRRTVALAMLAVVVLWLSVEFLDLFGAELCAEDFGCLPETR